MLGGWWGGVGVMGVFGVREEGWGEVGGVFLEGLGGYMGVGGYRGLVGR